MCSRRSRVSGAITGAIALLALLWPAAAPAPAQAQSPLLSLVADVVAGLGGTTPTGSVTLTIDGQPVATIPLLGGVAQFSTNSLLPGAHVVAVAYTGDSTHPPGLSVLLLPAGAGDIELTIGLNPPDAGAAGSAADTSAPTISITRPVGGAHYAQGEQTKALFACTDPDGAADVVRCEGSVPSGAPIDTGSPGRHPFTVTTADKAGNTAAATVTYVVDRRPGGPSTPTPAGPATPPPTPTATPTPTLIPPPPAVGVSGPAPGTPPTPTSPRRRRLARRPPARPRTGALPAAPGGARGGGGPPPARPAGGPGKAQLRPYDARSQPRKVLDLEVAAFTLLALVGEGGLVLAGMRTAAGASNLGRGLGEGGERGEGGGERARETLELGDYEGASVVYLAAAGGLAVGDRSRTWRWPGTRTVDRASMALPARLAVRSPLIARIVDDGAYLRSILGSAALSLELGGVVLGALAADHVGGQAIPPGMALTIAIAVLGAIDATAGLLALLTFAAGVLLTGGLDSAAAVRTLLALGALWFVVPVLAGAARPLRRDPPASAKWRFDRAADFVIASLIGAWAVQRIVIALPGLSERELAIGSHADAVALWVLLALVVRMLGETVAAHLYPMRLESVEPRGLLKPRGLLRLGAVLLRSAIFVFVAAVVVGWSWQLWVAGLLFTVPQVLAVYDERFPKSERLGRVLPEGLLKVVVILFVLSAIVALLHSSDAKSLIANSFVLLAIPNAVLSLLRRFGGESQRPIGWNHRLLGTAVLVLGVVQVLNPLF